MKKSNKDASKYLPAPEKYITEKAFVKREYIKQNTEEYTKENARD